MNKKCFLDTNIGMVKYAVSYHNGVKTHSDGSPFYDLRTFKNKRKANVFLKELQNNGYVERRG